MTMDPKELRSAIEAIILVSGEPVTLESLVEVFSDETRESINERLEEIRNDFESSIGGFRLEQTAGGYRLATRPEFDSFLRRFFSKQNEGRLSIAALETLSIIAYRQPITAPEIADIRGVNSSGVLRTLLDRKMIRIAGRKNVVGSPFLYRTTREFLLHFGLNSIQDLPKLEEFAEILGENLTEEDLLRGPVDENEGEGEPAAEPEASSGSQSETIEETAQEAQNSASGLTTEGDAALAEELPEATADSAKDDLVVDSEEDPSNNAETDAVESSVAEDTD